jgi:hypothetical protein
MVIVTSAGPARALGLKQKGHLGAGADGDVTIYSAKPDSDGVMFTHPRYVLKGGKVVVEEGQIRAITEGRVFLVHPEFDPAIEDFIRPIFQKLYTLSFENYPTGDDAAEAPRNRAVRSPMITLTLKQPVEGVPLEAESICPDVMVTLDNAGVRALPVYFRQAPVPHRRLLHRRWREERRDRRALAI